MALREVDEMACILSRPEGLRPPPSAHPWRLAHPARAVVADPRSDVTVRNVTSILNWKSWAQQGIERLSGREMKDEQSRSLLNYLDVAWSNIGSASIDIELPDVIAYADVESQSVIQKSTIEWRVADMSDGRLAVFT
jgi:hypothetical protein